MARSSLASPGVSVEPLLLPLRCGGGSGVLRGEVKNERSSIK